MPGGTILFDGKSITFAQADELRSTDGFGPGATISLTMPSDASLKELSLGVDVDRAGTYPCYSMPGMPNFHFEVMLTPSDAGEGIDKIYSELYTTDSGCAIVLQTGCLAGVSDTITGTFGPLDVKQQNGMPKKISGSFVARCQTLPF
jgi:hypothetical protein